ncbi:MAG TPA: hypothetical protein PK228_08915 [Saprospiraceae bacterium]|nr:hypothetical protein [Saprospiraceae bacterium]
MSSYAIHFKDADKDKIKRLIDFVRSLDYVKSVEPFQANTPVKKEEDIVPTQSNEFVPVSEIKTLYPNQWVLLANPQKKGVVLLGGQVLMHDSDKREFALKAKDLLTKYAGLMHFFTGETAPRAHTGLARKVSI